MTSSLGKIVYRYIPYFTGEVDAAQEGISDFHWRKRLLKENALFSPIEFLENIAVSDAVSPSALMDSRDYHEVWDLIECHISDQKQIAWVKWLVVNNAYIPGFDESPQAPNLSSQEKCEIRDKIAETIKSKIQRLVSFVKEKQKGKRRRSYECL